MGNKVNKNEFYVYARKDNNKWDHTLYTFPPDENSAISIFKHLVWRFALQREKIFEKYISIYLYKGEERLIKAHLIKEEGGYNKLQMDFLNDIYASKWDVCEEKIIDHNTLWKETSFNQMFVPLTHDNDWTRKWLSIKP